MRKFKITFPVEELYLYTTTVEAETPEKALEIFNQNPHNFDWDDAEFMESHDIGHGELEGEWLEDNGDGYYLKRINEPEKYMPTFRGIVSDNDGGM
jgi:hypothetical protein